jgi:hypothetical protein
MIENLFKDCNSARGANKTARKLGFQTLKIGSDTETKKFIDRLDAFVDEEIEFVGETQYLKGEFVGILHGIAATCAGSFIGMFVALVIVNKLNK